MAGARSTPGQASPRSEGTVPKVTARTLGGWGPLWGAGALEPPATRNPVPFAGASG